MLKRMSVVICGLGRHADDSRVRIGADRDGEDQAAAKNGDATADAAITAAVKTKLLADTKVGGLKIDVDTKDHVVTLTGQVHSAAERAEAVRLAQDDDRRQERHQQARRRDRPPTHRPAPTRTTRLKSRRRGRDQEGGGQDQGRRPGRRTQDQGRRRQDQGRDGRCGDHGRGEDEAAGRHEGRRPEDRRRHEGQRRDADRHGEERGREGGSHPPGQTTRASRASSTS